VTRGVAHPQDLRAEVVAAVMAGTTIAQAARQYGLSKSLVSEWMKASGNSVRTIRTEKEFEELLMLYLERGMRAMIVQAEVYADPEYCRTQGAHELAIAHGVLGDKLVGFAAAAQALGLIGLEARGAIIEQSALEPPVAPSGATYG
jgi:transposase-like protein